MFASAQFVKPIRIAVVGLIAAFLAICAVNTATGPASSAAADTTVSADGFHW